MISATSSLAGNILSGAFGTPAPSAINIPGASTASSTSSASAVSSASIIEQLLPTSDPEASFLSNIAFAQDTLSLLDNPEDNGAISGTPSSYVQQIISKLAPGASTGGNASTSSTANAATTTSPTAGGDNSTSSSLPPEGILA